MYRKSYGVVAWTYEAGMHCLECAQARFGVRLEDDVDPPADREGNPVSPAFVDALQEGTTCDTCGVMIE